MNCVNFLGIHISVLHCMRRNVFIPSSKQKFQFLPSLFDQHVLSMHNTGQACSTFYVVQAASAKFGLHVGKTKASRTVYNHTYDFTCVFLHISRAVKIRE